MKGRKSTRWEVSQQSAPPAVRPRPRRWRSYDLKGPLPRSTTRALEVAIYSLPVRTPWPAIDEEAWWCDVLADRRLRRSSAKALSEKDENAGQRLDRLPVKSLTFSCAWCGQRTAIKVAELIRMFGRDRVVVAIFGLPVVSGTGLGSHLNGAASPLHHATEHFAPTSSSWTNACSSFSRSRIPNCSRKAGCLFRPIGSPTCFAASQSSVPFEPALSAGTHW